MRVERSFAFVDVTGFTALTQLQGDERAVEVLAAFRALLRGVCARRGVRIAKWLGDGVMLVCVSVRPLLETVLELHYVMGVDSGVMGVDSGVMGVDSGVMGVDLGVMGVDSGPVGSVSIRSGVTSGQVILMEGDDYVGHCVNVASRLCDLAEAGEALAAPSVLSALPSWGVAAGERQVTLRGVENPVPAASIAMAEGGADVSSDPICGLPLTHDTAEEIAHDVRGSVVLFCSSGCVDTWRRRPAARRDEG